MLRFTQGGEFGARVRVRGSVVCVRPGEWLQLQEGGAGLRVSSTQDPAPAVGDFIEALGFPEPTVLGPALEDAVLTKLGAGELPAPLDTAARDALRQHGRLIRTDGVLVEKQSDGDGQRLILRGEGALFVAALPRERPPSWDAFAPGCRLAVTGLCQVNVGSESFTLGYPEARGFSLHLRGGDDVRLLAPAAWWTPQRLTIALSILGALLALVALWTFSLRRKNALLHRAERELLGARDALARRVDARTGQLQEQIRARLEQRAAFTAVAAERTRMARDLHDSLQQRLASAALRLDGLRRTLPQNGATTELESLTQMLRDGQDEVRRSVWDLRALALDKQTLAEAIRESVRLLLESTGVRGEVNVEGQPRELSAAAENHLLRIAQEAVGNVLAHARASELHVTLAFEPAAVRLRIEDDGAGFIPPPPGAGDTGHYGLADIRERARALGGTATIQSGADLGTTVLVVAQI